MHLEHLNLVVQDLDSTLAFYQAAFPQWHVRGQGTQKWYGTERRWLHFGDDFQYLTFCDNGTGENRNLQTNTIGLSHFAYVTQNLDATVTRLAAAGFLHSKDGNNTQYRKNIYFNDPNGFEVEFVEYLSDLPNERNEY
ncbi:glyoxalase [Saccharobesus litoralis]|uniref:Glyoxalase n=1 Tax=Saccharobesus litoralis TaxID=2172099 RepID=A0A2S0VNV7_9ALTE|nr:VOC family protein [Saccharobesus litoralis]AWB65873.1 glyoxalase [Saccharobesus litoralis]